MYRVDDVLRDGNLGGRAGADALCQASANRPAGSANAHAFISVAAGDAIADMPGNYGVPTTGTISGPTGTLIANNWVDLLDGSISVDLQTAGVLGAATLHWFTGSNADGSLSAFNCSGWTSNAGAVQSTTGRRDRTDNTWIDFLNPFCNNTYP